MLVDINFKNKLDLSFFETDCDKLTLLKSFFLLNGGFYYNQDNNKNSKGYNFEFVLKDEHTANIVLTLLKEHNFELKKIKRQSNHVVYTKNSNIISDLFVLLGATYTSLEIQNTLAIREMRNNINRQNNCFESNLEKTLDASAEQLKAINYIIDNYSIDYLNENLREVALARIANPDISLNELRMILNSNISRAEIKYRLDKIIEIYKKLIG
jgi:DNA-binding protein WhiA